MNDSADGRHSGNKRSKGIIGEEVAVGFLKGKGYVVIERNFNTVYGEIDIIAQKKSVMVFVEVKLRKNSLAEAMSSISASKKKKLTRTALIYLQQRPQYSDYFCRFDIIAVIETCKDNEFTVKHIENAFLIDEVDYEL